MLDEQIISPLKKHYISSITPFETSLIKQQQITKTKDFYKPGEMIWNNPHRTSSKIYAYYHQLKDNFEKDGKTKIQKMEQLDRTDANKKRIRMLTEHRDQTRQSFYQRQISRM